MADVNFTTYITVRPTNSMAIFSDIAKPRLTKVLLLGSTLYIKATSLFHLNANLYTNWTSGDHDGQKF